MLKRFLHEDEGVLTFEWIVLLTILVVGVIGGIAGIRDALMHEAQGTVGAVLALDQSYSVGDLTGPLGVSVDSINVNQGACATSTASYSSYEDGAPVIWGDGRVTQGSLTGISQGAHHPVDLCPIQ